MEFRHHLHAKVRAWKPLIETTKCVYRPKSSLPAQLSRQHQSVRPVTAVNAVQRDYHGMLRGIRHPRRIVSTSSRRVHSLFEHGISRSRHFSSAKIQWEGANFAKNKSGDGHVLQSAFLPFPRLVIPFSLLLTIAFGYYYITDTRSSIHQYLVPPLLRFLYPDAEDAHHATVSMLKQLHMLGLHPRERPSRSRTGVGSGTASATDLSVDVFGQTLDNPLGVSAGLDKDGEIPSALFELGPGIVEIGGITPLPQAGNPRPRVWRVEGQRALINRYGLNSAGAAHVAGQLRARVKAFARAVGLGVGEEAEQMVLDGEAGVPPGSLVPGRLLAVQIAKNKAKAAAEDDLEAATKDFIEGVRVLGKYADIITINVSSPGTPGLRDLQKTEPLKKLLTAVVDEAKVVKRKIKPAVMVKISPDEDSEEEIKGICDAIWESGVDGVIVANTTKSRPDQKRTALAPQGYPLSAQEAAALQEQGGYSGPLIFEKTLALVKKYRQRLDEDLLKAKEGHRTPKVIFASGGITNGDQALKVLNAGASVAMSYTGLTYAGSGFFTSLKREMRDIIGT